MICELDGILFFPPLAFAGSLNAAAMQHSLLNSSDECLAFTSAAEIMPPAVSSLLKERDAASNCGGASQTGSGQK